MTAVIADYIALVRSGTVQVCADQIKLVDLIEKAFQTEELRVDEDQLARYLGLQKHFPFQLLPWEKFVFALHNCVYKPNGMLRWPNLAVFVGRGAGKNGYLAFEDFALITPVNGIREYDIDIFAMSEDQAKRSFDDIWNILEGNSAYFQRYFYWTKEVITNLKTGSSIHYYTSSAKTKDSLRPGKIDFDELQAYENSALMDVVITGLGKKPMPRRTYISTFGDVRDGPMDRTMEKAEDVLSGIRPDNGWIYFVCRLDSDAEIDDETCWAKANPSLYDPNRPQLLEEIRQEYVEYKEDPASHASFPTRRMNRPQNNAETAVTSWDNILAACRPIPEELLIGRPATFAIDYASTQDFVAAGALLKLDGCWYWITHSWCCLQSKTLSRIKFPIEEAAARGELTLIDAPEINPDIPVEWCDEMVKKYQLQLLGIDHFRYTLLSKSLAEHGYTTDRQTGNIKLTYTPEQSMVAPIISSAFLNHHIVWGDSMMMRWYTNNATRILDKRGNISFGKIEPKTRKTDGFMAMVMAFVCAHRPGIELDAPVYNGIPDIYIFDD